MPKRLTKNNATNQRYMPIASSLRESSQRRLLRCKPLSKLVQGIVAESRDPNVDAVEGSSDATRAIPFAQLSTIAGPQLSDVRIARHPDANSIEGYSITAGVCVEGAQKLSVTRPQLAHRAVKSVRDPHVCAVKGYAGWRFAHAKRPQSLAVAG